MPIPVRLIEEKFTIDCETELFLTAKGVISTLLPYSSVTDEQGARQIKIRSLQSTEGIFTEVELGARTSTWKHRDSEILDSSYKCEDWERRKKERVRHGLFELLCAEYKIPPSPWGILVGVRPTKLYHRLVDRGFSYGRINEILTDVYCLQPEKLALLADIAQSQRSFFHPSPISPISIYIGIPFCPTRCSYCSFAAYPMSSHGHLLKGFFENLCTEIEAIGELLEHCGASVESIYIGGGTPTILSDLQLEILLSMVRKWLWSSDTKEVTVEAGRPETLTESNLGIMAAFGVDRVSINPQTMRDSTLQRVGRAHTAKQVTEAFVLARQANIPLINMDIILGLPGEGISDVQYTLEQIGDLQPDNLTAHSLAMKRAANMRRNVSSLELAQEQGYRMNELVQNKMASLHLEPYYLYRQRYILGDLENIGYARPEAESVYNIQMMEERQTIVGLGGGGITKLVSSDLSLRRLANPKCPATYAQQLTQSLPAKISQIRHHFAV